MTNTFSFDTYGEFSNPCFWISLYLFRMTCLFRPMICLFVIFRHMSMVSWLTRRGQQHPMASLFNLQVGVQRGVTADWVGWFKNPTETTALYGCCFNETHEIYGNVYVFCASSWSSLKEIMGYVWDLLEVINVIGGDSHYWSIFLFHQIFLVQPNV